MSLANSTPTLSQLKAALLIKVIQLETNTTGTKKDINIYVLGAPKLAESLTELIGKPVGKATLGRVDFGDNIPEKRYDVIFVGTGKNIQKVIKYTHTYKVLSATDRADVFQRGISVSILMENRRPKISLNPSASEAEGLNWILDYRMFRNVILEFRKAN